MSTELKLIIATDFGLFWSTYVYKVSIVEYVTALLSSCQFIWIHMEIFSLMFETERKVKARSPKMSNFVSRPEE